MALTHQEAEEIVGHALALLDGFRSIAASEPDEDALQRAIRAYRDETASSFLNQSAPEDLQEGLRRYGKSGLWTLVWESVRIDPEDAAARPQAQALLAETSRFIDARQRAAAVRQLEPFAGHLEQVARNAASCMRSGWWVLPTRRRAHAYGLAAELAELLQSDAGQELARLSGLVHEPSGEGWSQVQANLHLQPQAFSQALREVAPELVGSETSLCGLSDREATEAGTAVQAAAGMLQSVQRAQAIKSDAGAVTSALDACLSMWAHQIIFSADEKVQEAGIELYGRDRLEEVVEQSLRICPSVRTADPIRRRLASEGNRYRLIVAAQGELSSQTAAIDCLSSLHQHASMVRQDVSWLLLSEGERRDALAAAHELERFLESPAATRLEAACHSTRKAAASGWHEAEHAIDETPDELVAALRELAPTSIGDEDSVGGLTRELAERAAQAISDADEILGLVGRARAAKADPGIVEDAARAWQHEKAKDTIAQAPIDVINQGARQFQLKGLKESGHLTLGSLLDASAFELEKIPGMGRGVAFEAQQMARDYAAYQEKRTRIQLSLDDTSPAASALLQALGTYRASQSVQQALSDLKPAIQRTAQLRKMVGRLKPDLVWATMAEAMRQEHIGAVGALEAYLAGPDVAALQDAAHLVLEAKAPDAAQARQSFAQDPVGFATTLEQLVPDALGGDAGAYGLSGDLAQKVGSIRFSDAGLKVTLRPYQVWGAKYVLAQKHALLGDEMGLGKTIQALAVMASLHTEGYRRFMVVCPLSVLENWCREIASKSVLIPLKIYGPDAQQSYRVWQKTGRVAVTTYETLARLKTENVSIDFLVVDEAHYAKNPKAKRTQNLMRFVEASDYVLFMTGTALENNAQEMVQLISMLQPEAAQAAAATLGKPFADAFRDAVASVYYRRRREDVLGELPELTESKEWCTLSEDEIPPYMQALQEGFMAARRVSWNVGDLTKSGKARRLREIVEQAREDDRKVLIFSYFRSTLADIAEFLGPGCIGPITGSISPLARQKMVDAFEQLPAGTALVAQIQAGGTGLNIQAASVVILCEPQCKPSIENQAISRAYRMGQKRNVFVYRLLCANTIDEQIMKIIDEKQHVFDAFADRSAAAEQVDQAISQKTMDEIVQEERRKYGSRPDLEK